MTLAFLQLFFSGNTLNPCVICGWHRISISLYIWQTCDYKITWFGRFKNLPCSDKNSTEGACLNDSEYSHHPFLLLFLPQQVNEEAFFSSFAFPRGLEIKHLWTLGLSQIKHFIISGRTYYTFSIFTRKSKTLCISSPFPYFFS